MLPYTSLSRRTNLLPIILGEIHCFPQLVHVKVEVCKAQQDSIRRTGTRRLPRKEIPVSELSQIPTLIASRDRHALTSGSCKSAQFMREQVAGIELQVERDTSATFAMDRLRNI